MKKLIVSIICITLGLLIIPFVGCQKPDPNELIIGASSIPHAQILRQAVQPMKDKGYTLKIQEISGYATMNDMLAHNDIDANYFQHQQFLDDYLANNSGSKLSVLQKVHYEPMGIYKAQKDTLQLTSSDTIVIPNDTTNQQRALELLVDAGIIVYNQEKQGDKYQIDSYNGLGDFDIKNIDTATAETIPTLKPDVALMVVNGNNALNATNIDTQKDILHSEPPSLGEKYANLVAIRTSDIESPKMQALREILSSQSIAEYITNTYDGLVMPL